MFFAQPMNHVHLVCLASEAQDMALLLARHGRFGPARATDAAWPERPGEAYREIYVEAASRLAKILEHCGTIAPAPAPADAIAPNLRELKGINGRLRDIWQACSHCFELDIRLREEKRRLESLRETFARLRALRVDLSRLMRADSLLDTRLGQVPAANIRRLGEALALAGYVLSRFDQAGDQVFVVVAGPRGAAQVGGLLAQAGWRDLPIPPELRTHPDQAQRYLQEEARRLEEEALRHCEVRQDNLGRHAAWLGQAQLLLRLARPLAETALAGYRGHGQLAAFDGWVPRRLVGDLDAALETRFQGRYLIAAREPASGDAVPTLLHHPFWLRPFVPLVKSYGVPRYGEFDPALLFAGCYLLMFGAMFGDLGHGAVLLALAAFLGGRLAWLRPVGMAAGVASMLFGLLYGSVFGYEDLLPPLWQSPLHDPGRMLAIAVAGGVVFIAVAQTINLFNRLRARQWGAALLDGGGLAGLVFYLAAAQGLHATLGGPGFGLPAAATAATGLLLVAAWKWREHPAPLLERALVTLIETLETASNLFANTLSFLRVAAFSLNHVALALAVFTLAGHLDGFGHGLAVALGNGVIIVLEGAIVAIQALRLMYYEGFSRFYHGDGVEFAPLRLEEGKPG